MDDFWDEFFLQFPSISDSLELPSPNQSKRPLKEILMNCPAEFARYRISSVFGIKSFREWKSIVCEKIAAGNEVVLKPLDGNGSKNVGIINLEKVVSCLGYGKGKQCVVGICSLDHFFETWELQIQTETVGMIVDERITYEAKDLTPELKIYWIRNQPVFATFNVQDDSMAVWHTKGGLILKDSVREILPGNESTWLHEIENLIFTVIPGMLPGIGFRYGRTDFLLQRKGEEYQFKLNEVQNYGTVMGKYLLPSFLEPPFFGGYMFQCICRGQEDYFDVQEKARQLSKQEFAHYVEQRVLKWLGAPRGKRSVYKTRYLIT